LPDELQVFGNSASLGGKRLVDSITSISSTLSSARCKACFTAAPGQCPCTWDRLLNGGKVTSRQVSAGFAAALRSISTTAAAVVDARSIARGNRALLLENSFQLG
jgi:hypothetical protein